MSIPPAEPLRPVTDAEVCRYVAEVCMELRTVARRPRLRLLAYQIDTLRELAERTAREVGEDRR